MFSDEAHFRLNGLGRIVDFGVKISQKICKSYPYIPKKSQFGAVYELVASLDCDVSVNGERYRNMISNFFLPKMQELDGARRCHMPHSMRNNGLI